MKKYFGVLAVTAALLWGCAAPSPPTTDNTPPVFSETVSSETPEITAEETVETAAEPNETAAETHPSEPITVSPLAEKDLLLPTEDYSWEREYPIEYIVLHFVSDVVNSKNDPHNLKNVKKIFEDTNVSSNYIIDRDGSIVCFVSEDRAAWHAGAGTYADDEKYTNKMNKYSIGIEMLAIGSKQDMSTYITEAEYDSLAKEHIGFTDSQYTSLKLLLEDICQRNGIPFERSRIIGHDEYNPNKSDPGELFDWDRLFE